MQCTPANGTRRKILLDGVKLKEVDTGKYLNVIFTGNEHWR